MAETVDISAIARVVDLASPVIKAITGAISGMGSAATAASTAVAGMSGKMAGTVGQMVGGLGRAGGEIEGFGQKISKMFGPLQGLAGVASLAGMTAAVVSLTNQAKKLDDLSQSLHVTAGMLEAFERAAGGPEAADAALKHLHDTIAGIAAGGKDADSVVGLMQKFGLSAKQIADGNLDVILPRIAAGFAANTDPVLRSRMAVALFGEEGKKLIPFLAQGPAGVKALAAEMERLGLAAKIPAAKDAAKALDALGQSVTDAKNNIAAAILPAFTPMVEVVTKFVNANQALLSQAALPAFLGLIATSVLSLGRALLFAAGPWGVLVGAIITGATLIYENWDKVKGFFDATLPGFLPALEAAGAGIAKWASESSAKITEGFQTGGISGGLSAVWDIFKSVGNDAITWIVTTFNAIPWGDIGKQAGDFAWDAFKSMWQQAFVLAEGLLQSFNNIDWGQVAQWIINGITAYLQSVTALLDWFRGLDWKTVGSDIGTFLIDAMVAYFKAAVAIDVWLVQLVTKIATAFANADWSAIGKAILDYFGTLIKTIVSIGYDLISGLLEGMWKALTPGLSAIGDKIKSSFKDAATSAKNWFFGGGGEEGTPGMPPPRLNPAGGTPTVRTEANANIALTAPPGWGATVTRSDQSGPGKTAVAVGNSGVAEPVH